MVSGSAFINFVFSEESFSFIQTANRKKKVRLCTGERSGSIRSLGYLVDPLSNVPLKHANKFGVYVLIIQLNLVLGFSKSSRIIKGHSRHVA
jgi:hypothetical protein